MDITCDQTSVFHCKVYSGFSCTESGHTRHVLRKYQIQLYLLITAVCDTYIATNDNVKAWERFAHYYLFLRGIHLSLVDFLRQSPVIRSFGDFVVVSHNKVLTNRLVCRWFETTWRLLLYWLDYCGFTGGSNVVFLLTIANYMIL